jgi:hypothetical protein
VQKRLNPEQIEAIARRFESGDKVSPQEFRAVCETALELLRSSPSRELVRLAMLLVSSRGALPLKSEQAEAFGAAVLKAAQVSLVGVAWGALQESHAALALGRNWIEGLARVPPGSNFGSHHQGLARSMTKTMRRHLASTSEVLNFGMTGQLEPLDPAEPGYRELPAFDQIARRQCTTELERTHEELRTARLGILKIARFTHALSGLSETRTWDETLGQLAARNALDISAHLNALERLP